MNKLLFHADFSAFLTYGEPITGQEYFALPQGARPQAAGSNHGEYEEKRRTGLSGDSVSYHGHIQKKPIALRTADVSKFSGTDVNLVRQTVEKFWKMSATEISDQSHLFLGWKAAHLKETIPYSTSLVSRRPPTDHERKRGLRLEGLAAKHLSAHR